MKMLARTSLLSLLLAGSLPALAQDLSSFEKQVTQKTLANGLRVIVIETKGAPVFSFSTRVMTGSDREVLGITGLAHMFEHMAFKGTDTIGTTNYAAEKVALEKVEKTYAAYDTAKRQPTRDDKKVAELEKAFKAAVAEADAFVVKNEFGEIVDREGGVGLNASTNADETQYYYSLPANRFELWAYLESERFLKPVMREFYKERDVVNEERRMRTDSQPVGRLIEQFLAAAFTAHPYGQPVVGWASDLNTFSATDAMTFYENYYQPSNMILSVVGGIKTAEVMPVIEKYFSRLPTKDAPPPLRTVEPQQRAERTVVLREAAQPFYIEGYHKPDVRDADDAVYDVLGDLLSNGRTSRLYKSLVRDKKIAAAAQGFAGFPGNKYPSLFAFLGVPLPGKTIQEVQAAIRAELDKVKAGEVTDEELSIVKNRARANLVRRLEGNQGLANQVTFFESRYGDWRAMFKTVDAMQKVTKEDIQRVAKKIFTDENRTIGIIESTTNAPARRTN
ncbi:MAG: insulinase family protein [Vicinamibacteria bacterium]|nr:insulinase family protein [Vicinamibacteria bacterium]